MLATQTPELPAEGQDIRQLIKEKLALSLKALQKRYVASDTVVTSEDSDANLLCCALEAVFIHRLKNKYVRYESGGRGRKDQRPVPQPSFWNLLKTVTHWDVISELTKLSFVGTEVGRSRAWLRLALNHGLLECYLTSLFRDGSDLRAYYQPGALLLHPEDREVLLSYVQGLASLCFSLSYKSAVLNQWTATPLALAGLCPAAQADAHPLNHRPLTPKPGSKESWDTASQSSRSSEGGDPPKGILQVPAGEQGASGDRLPQGDQGGPGQEQPIRHSSTVSLETCWSSSQLSSSISSDSLLLGQDLDLDLVDSRRAPTDVVLDLRDGSGPDSQDSTREDSFVSSASHDHCSGNSTSAGSSGSDGETPAPSTQNHGDHPKESPQNHTAQQTQKLCNDSTQKPPTHTPLSQNLRKTQDKQNHNLALSTPDHPIQGVQNEDVSTTAGAEVCLAPSVPVVLVESTEGPEMVQEGLKMKASGREKKNQDAAGNGGLVPCPGRKQSSGSLSHSRSWISDEDIYKPHLGEESDTEEDHPPEPPTNKAQLTGKAPASVVHRRQIGQPNPFRGLLKLGHLERRGGMGIWKDYFCELSPFEFRLYLDDEERTCAENCSLLRCEAARHSSSTDGRFQLSFHGKHLYLRAADRGEAEDWVDRIVEAAKKCMPANRHDDQWEELQFAEDKDKDELVSSGSSGSSSSAASPLRRTSFSGRAAITAPGPASSNAGAAAPPPPPPTEELDWRRGGVDPEPDAIIEAVLYSSSSSSKRGPGARGNAWVPHVFSLSLERLQGFKMQEDGRKGCARVSLPVEAIRDVVPDVALGGPEFFKLLTSGGEMLRLRAQTAEEARSWRVLLRGALDSYLESEEEGAGSNVRRLVRHALKEDGAMLEQLFSVPPHCGLDTQGFTCAGCPRQIGLSLAKARLCDFFGRYYCESCHRGDLSIIPSRMIHNWDLIPRQVSRRALRLLGQVEHEPLLNLERLNPGLLDHAQPMAQVHQLRLGLSLLGEYLSACRSGAHKIILARMEERSYLLESSQQYSVKDLRQIADGQYVAYLSSLVQLCSEHVHQCDLCSQRGFICQICHDDEIIFPFQLDSTRRCAECKAVFHAACKLESSSCPRCLRFRKYLERDSQD